MNSFIFNFNSVKNFIILNIIIFSVFVGANFMIRGSLDRQLRETYRSEYETIQLSSSPYKFISIGTSHGIYSIDFSYVDINGLNIAQAGQPYRYDLEKLLYYDNLIGPDTLIIIPVSFHSLCLDDDNWLPYEVVYRDNFPILGMSNILTLRTYLQGHGSNQDSLDNEFFDTEYEKITPSNCNEMLGLHYLELIIKRYKNVLLITTPYLEKYLGPIDDFEKLYYLIEKLTYNYSIPYTDYSRDIRFQNEDLFRDASHLNQTGRRLFTLTIIDEIDESFFK